MDNLSIHLRAFNDRVKTMNQTQARDITLTANEARNIHADMFNLLAHLAELSEQLNNRNTVEDTIEVTMDGGGFKE